MSEYVQMKDSSTPEEKAAAIAAIAERSKNRHLSNTGASRGSLRVNVQGSIKESIGTITSRFRKPAGNKEFEQRESKKTTKGRQKVRGGTQKPSGWYTISQGADSVTGRDMYKREKAITDHGIFINGKIRDFSV